MSLGQYSNYSNQSQPQAGCQTEDRMDPEVILAEAFKKDLGVTIDPQALRIFIRWRWDRIQKLAHAIHDA